MEIASPPNELAVFAVDERGLTVNRAPSSRDLYDAIVRPIEPLLARAREVVFVLDRPLVGVAFAALAGADPRAGQRARRPPAHGAAAADKRQRQLALPVALPRQRQDSGRAGVDPQRKMHVRRPGIAQRRLLELHLPLSFSHQGMTIPNKR